MFDVLESLETPSGSSFSLELRCKLFNKISADLVHLPVEKLGRLSVKFECWTPNRSIRFDMLTEYFQYVMTSLILNLEFKYPFIFSFYGKRLVETNYTNLIRSTTEWATPLEGEFVPDKNDILGRCLTKLQFFILYEYNTINIMMECDTNPYRSKMCRESMITGNFEFIRKSLKNSGFCLRVPASPHFTDRYECALDPGEL